MKLSAEQFAELLSSFQSPESQARFDRRRASRVELQARVNISPIVAGKRLDPIPVTVCDFSARGALFLHTAEIPAGQQFVAELPRRSGGSVSLLCTVIRSTPITSKMHRIGAEFSCVLHQQAPHNAEADDREQKRIRESMMR